LSGKVRFGGKRGDLFSKAKMIFLLWVYYCLLWW